MHFPNYNVILVVQAVVHDDHGAGGDQGDDDDEEHESEPIVLGDDVARGRRGRVRRGPRAPGHNRGQVGWRRMEKLRMENAPDEKEAKVFKPR